MSRAPLALTLSALAAVVAVVALPAGATPPGTNGKLVFERPTRDGANLFTVGADGSGLTRLTGLRGVEGDSSWSPEGSKVEFVRARNPERGPYEIWVVNADGRRPRAAHAPPRVQHRPGVVAGRGQDRLRDRRG